MVWYAWWVGVLIMLGVSGKIVAGAAGKRNFELEALTHIARLSSPSRALETALNTLIAGLKADGIWDNIYAICVQHNVQGESLYDLKGTQDSTNLTGATWSSAGWSLGETTGLMDTQVVPTSSSGMIVVNDNHLMCYLATTLTDTTCYLMGAGSAPLDFISIRYGVNPAGKLSYVGDSWSTQAGANLTITTPGGCCLGSYLSGTSRMRAGSSQTSSSQTPANSTNGSAPIHVGHGNSNLALLPPNPSETFTAWSSGSGLTPTQFNDYYTHIQDYMVTMGWEV